eukprot:12067991-Alexandrium_andersonii.AAC.1
MQKESGILPWHAVRDMSLGLLLTNQMQQGTYRCGNDGHMPRMEHASCTKSATSLGKALVGKPKELL